MQIRHLRIENFRGIKELDWAIKGDFICLIGPGDSTKSTILDAIELALTPRWEARFHDVDFYKADISDKKIIVEVTISNPPVALLREEKFGLKAFYRGKSGECSVEDSHLLDDIPLDRLYLSLRLEVDESLEPSWVIYNRWDPEGKRIGAKDRQQLGMLRVGDYLGRHLTWSRGSLLYRITEKEKKLSAIFADLARIVGDGFDGETLETYKRTCEIVNETASNMGVSPSSEKDGYVPGFDVRGLNLGASGIALHDGRVPLSQSGLGTKRIVLSALQHEAVEGGAIFLVDEIEHGLEPHRIHRLINVLREGPRNLSNPEGGKCDSGFRGQAIMTTHSPVVIEELNAIELNVVRNVNGTTTVEPIDSSLQNIVRSNPSALLAHKVIICEGKTEIGLCKALDKWWPNVKVEGRDKYRPFAYLGVAAALGDGNATKNTPKTARAFADLGYDAAIIADTDDPLKWDGVSSKGIRIIEWGPNQQTGNGTCIEVRICLDLPPEGLVEVLELAVKIAEDRGSKRPATSVRDSVAHWARSTSPKRPLPEDDYEAWWDLLDENVLRDAVGKAAHKNTWFKRIDRGEKLGEIVVKYLHQIPDRDLARKIRMLREWVDKDD